MMRRVMVYLNFVTDKKSEQRVIPEVLVNEELTRLTKHIPQTAAEKEFHRWLRGWKDRLGGVK